MTPAHVKSFLSGTKEPLRNAVINRLTELGLDWEDRVDALWRLAEDDVVVVLDRPGDYPRWYYAEPRMPLQHILELVELL